MGDYIVRAIAKEAGVRALACVTTETVREAARRHQASPLAAAALGYGLTASALLGALLKVQQRISIKLEGNGPLGKLVADSDSYGHLRGYVANPFAQFSPPLGPHEVAEGLGRLGLLTVVKDLGLKNLYEGVVPRQSGDPDADLTYYLIMSEQIPSLVEMGAPVDGAGDLLAAGGLLLQTMPGHDATTLAHLAERLDDLPPIGDLLAAGHTPERIIAEVFGDVAFDVLETRELCFRCGCSRERSYEALKILDLVDLQTLLMEGEAVIDCHFCHERYVFDRAELEALVAVREVPRHAEE
jgi:molecular chaperone Hsp33